MTATEQEHGGGGQGDEHPTCSKECTKCGAPCERDAKGHRNHYCAGCTPPVRRPRAEVAAEESAEVGAHSIDGGRFTYSAAGDPGHSACCRVPHGLYADGVHVLDLPRTVARIIQGGTGSEMTGYLVSARRDTANVLLPYRDVAEGKWAPRLGMRPSGDRQVMAAAASAIFHAAHVGGVPEHRQALRPSDVTTTGHIPTPLEGTLPPGYMSADPYREGETDAEYAARTHRAHLTIASIAANNKGNGKLALLLGLSAAAPYLGALTRRAAGEAGVVELAGKARAGKSSMLMAAASLWGPPSLPPDAGVIIAWDGTSKGILRTLGQLGIFSPYIDETGTSEMDQSQWFRFIMSAAQGASRVTSTQDGMGSARSAGWTGLIFASGNREIITETPIGRYAGVPARVTTISGPFTRSAAESDRLVAAASQGYGLLGPRVLETITVEKMGEFARWAGTVIGTPEGDTGRSVALRLALGCAGAMALDHVLGTDGRIRDAALAAAIEYIRGVADVTTDREMALERLAEDIAARPSAWPSAAAWAEQLQPRPEGLNTPPEVTPRLGIDRNVAGVVDGDSVYVFPQWWRAMVEESGISARDALADLYQRGELVVSDSQRAKGEWTGRAPRWGSQPRPFVYRISRDAIDQAWEDSDPEQDGQGDGTTSGAAAAGPPPENPPADEVRWNAPELTADPPAEVAEVSEQRAAAAARGKGGRFAGYSPEQAAARDAALRVLADPELAKVDAKDSRAVGKWASRLGLMLALEGNHRRGGDGAPPAFGPRSKGRGAFLQPWGRGRNRGKVPVQVDQAMVIRAYTWERAYDGPLARLDRNMAYLAATATAEFALDQLVEGGECDLTGGRLLPGYYLVTVYPWTEKGLPSPLDTAEVGTEIWVAAPTAQLLGELHRAGRWPSGVASATFTSARKGRLLDWAHFARDLRREAAEVYGPGSVQEKAAKRAYAMAFGMLSGSRNDRGDLEWPNCYSTRKDWADTIISLSAANIWRDADDCLKVAPEAGPVTLAATDALVLPADAVEAVTTVTVPGKTRPALRIDESGAALGTYKTQDPDGGEDEIA